MDMIDTLRTGKAAAARAPCVLRCAAEGVMEAKLGGGRYWEAPRM